MNSSHPLDERAEPWITGESGNYRENENITYYSRVGYISSAGLHRRVLSGASGLEAGLEYVPLYLCVRRLWVSLPDRELSVYALIYLQPRCVTTVD